MVCRREVVLKRIWGPVCARRNGECHAGLVPPKCSQLAVEVRVEHQRTASDAKVLSRRTQTSVFSRSAAARFPTRMVKEIDMPTTDQGLRRVPYGIPPPGFRLPDETHVGAVRLQVSDLERSVAYYVNVVGLAVQSQAGDTAALGPHEDERTLLWLDARNGVIPVPRRGVFGLYHFAILLPERAVLGRFAAHVSRIGERVGMADHRVSEAFYLWDPDGLGIEVYADRSRDTWAHDGAQLVMTTEPLDVANLIAAGSGGTWAGMPAGTVMGHVHLHVGSLNEADAFYHRALGFDKTVWGYPGALFFSAGGYHHHLATNTWSPGPSARLDQARLLDWELVVPKRDDAAAAAASIREAGYGVAETDDGWTAVDPWGTRLRIVFPPLRSE